VERELNMNRNRLKTYAPEARREFIEAATVRAAKCFARSI
jgi:hypothetical protein